MVGQHLFVTGNYSTNMEQEDPIESPTKKDDDEVVDTTEQPPEEVFNNLL